MHFNCYLTSFITGVFYMLHYNRIIAHEAISLTISLWGNIHIHLLRCSCGLKVDVMRSSSTVNAPSSTPYPPSPFAPVPIVRPYYWTCVLCSPSITTTLLLTHYNTQCNTHFKSANWHGESFIILGGKRARGSFDQWWGWKGAHPRPQSSTFITLQVSLRRLYIQLPKILK